MIYQIAITPSDRRAFGFNVKFCSESFSLPGMSWPMEDLNDVHFHHALHQLGCSPKQIATILRLIENPPTEVCGLNADATVDLFPWEEEDFSAYEFHSTKYEDEEDDDEEVVIPLKPETPKKCQLKVHLSETVHLATVIPLTKETTMGDLLQTITEMMEAEGEKDFNCERPLFFTKDFQYIPFMDDAPVEHDFMNVAMVDDDFRQLSYVHVDAHELGEPLEWMSWKKEEVLSRYPEKEEIQAPYPEKYVIASYKDVE